MNLFMIFKCEWQNPYDLVGFSKLLHKTLERRTYFDVRDSGNENYSINETRKIIYKDYLKDQYTDREDLNGWVVDPDKVLSYNYINNIFFVGGIDMDYLKSIQRKGICIHLINLNDPSVLPEVEELLCTDKYNPYIHTISCYPDLQSWEAYIPFI